MARYLHKSYPCYDGRNLWGCPLEDRLSLIRMLRTLETLPDKDVKKDKEPSPPL